MLIPVGYYPMRRSWYHLIRASRDCVVLVLHNHPSLSAFSLSVVLLNEAIDLNNKAKNIKDLQEAADYFLKSCYNVGINYEKR